MEHLKKIVRRFEYAIDQNLRVWLLTKIKDYCRLKEFKIIGKLPAFFSSCTRSSCIGIT